MAQGNNWIQCLEVVDQVERNIRRPQYVIFPEFWCHGKKYCQEVCHSMMKKYYSIDFQEPYTLNWNQQEKELTL